MGKYKKPEPGQTTCNFILRDYKTISRDTKVRTDDAQSGPEVIKRFSCSTQLSMKFVPLINLRLLTTVNSFLLNIAEHENFSANKYENANYCWHFHIY